MRVGQTVSGAGTITHDLTAGLGEADVISVLAVDTVGGWVFFIASPGAPLERYLYRAALTSAEQGPGAVERLTPAGAGAIGTHSYQLAPALLGSSDGVAYAVHSFSSFGQPGFTELVSLPEHKVIQPLVSNEALQHKLDALSGGAVSLFNIDIAPFARDLPEGVSTSLDAYAIFPPGFEPSSAPAASAPLLVHVYGEPAGCTVSDSYGGYQYLWHRLMAQRGFIVVSFDSRGTPSPKGRAWRKTAYKKIGITANNDQAAAVLALLARWPCIDPAKVGIWGWSGGGSSTLQAMFRFPEIYKAGAAVAFIADQRNYDTIYQERYMGVPDGSDDGWKDYIEGAMEPLPSPHIYSSSMHSAASLVCWHAGVR